MILVEEFDGESLRVVEVGPDHSRAITIEEARHLIRKGVKYLLEYLVSQGASSVQTSIITLGKDRSYYLTHGGEYKSKNSAVLDVANEKVLLSHDISMDPREATRKVKTFDKESSSLLSMPLYHRGKIFGQVGILSTPEKKFTIEDVRSFLSVQALCSDVAWRHMKSKHCISEELKQRKQMDVLKDKFLSTISHELRTPLNGIIGMITLLQPANEKQRDYMKVLKESSFQLLNLLNNLLDYTKISSERLILSKNPVNFSNILQESISLVEGRAIEKQLKIIKEFPPSFPPFIGDSQRIMQVLTNVISNAIKFTDRGDVRISVSCSRAPETGFEKRSLVTVVIKDTGIGVPADEQAKIFDPFYQSTSLSTHLSNSGTGLGLSITRKLLQLMGGDITLHSDGLGKGSCFTLTFIFDEEISKESLESDDKKVLQGAKVLVVDDRIDMRIQICELLFRWGCSPISLGSAEEALHFLRYDTAVDCAVIDVSMPHMSGIELSQELRREYPSIPIIGISSVEVNGGEKYFDFYMKKPISQTEVLTALLKSIRKEKLPGREHIGRSKVLRKTGSTKILIAEDDPINSYALREILLKQGFSEGNIKVVRDGESCVKEVSREDYDVVLMDIIMPNMDGISASKIIRKMKKSSIAIIAISASTSNADKQKCQEAGLDAYLTKPLLESKLISALEPFVEK